MTKHIDSIGPVTFGPFGRLYRDVWGDRTHAQEFEFTYNGRFYFGSIQRYYDRRAPIGQRVSYDVWLNINGRTIAHNHKQSWREALIAHFKAELERYLANGGV